MDKCGFQEAVIGCEQTLYRVAKSILHSDSDCEDAVQETILKAYKKLGSLRNDKYFNTWLVRILINECYKINKSVVKNESFSEYMTDEKAENTNISFELYQAIIGLEPKTRITIVLFYIEGYSIEEIKNILKIPEGTVKSRLHNGREQLKKMMEE